MPKKRKRSCGAGAYMRMLAGAKGNVATKASKTRCPPSSSARSGSVRMQLRTRPPRSEPLPDGLDRNFLPDFVARAAASVPRHAWHAIAKHLSKKGKGPITITLGTACSGSEIYLTALPFLEKELSQRLGRDIRFVHKWSCELDPQKRQWIIDNFSPMKLFADVRVLAEGPCHDYVSGTLTEVDVVDVLIAGTSCKDASRLNNHHTKRLSSVETASHTTGGTFQGFARLVRKFGRRCRVVFLENVTSLKDLDPKTGRSNFDGVARTMRSMGFRFISAEFSARDVGLPVSRPRLYMAGVRCPDEAEAQGCADNVLQSIFSGASNVPLKSLLCSKRRGSVSLQQAWMPEALTRGDRFVPVVENEAKWHQLHRKAWLQIPSKVKQQEGAKIADNHWLYTLPPRSRDLLLFANCRAQMSGHKGLSISLQISLNWVKESPATHLPTLVPNGILWLIGEGRPLLGVEALRLQGCDPSMLPGLAPESHNSSFLMNLAGNAFCVYQFCAWFFATLAAGDLC